MDEYERGIFEVEASFDKGSVILKVPGAPHGYGLEPEDAANIGLSLTNNALLIAKDRGLCLQLDFPEPLIESLSIVAEAMERIDETSDGIATIVSFEDRVLLELRGSNKEIMEADAARRLANSLLECARKADDYSDRVKEENRERGEG